VGYIGPVAKGPRLPHRVVAENYAAPRVNTVLVLLDEVTPLEAAADEVRRVIDIDRRLVDFIPRAAVAILAPKDEIFGMARMWELMAGVFPGWQIRVVRTRAEADAWLEGNRPARSGPETPEASPPL